MCTDLTRLRVDSNKNNKNNQQQKAKHVAGASKSKVYVFYDEVKVNF
jgi:hypothetical protein